MKGPPSAVSCHTAGQRQGGSLQAVKHERIALSACAALQQTWQGRLGSFEPALGARAIRQMQSGFEKVCAPGTSNRPSYFSVESHCCVMLYLQRAATKRACNHRLVTAAAGGREGEERSSHMPCSLQKHTPAPSQSRSWSELQTHALHAGTTSAPITHRPQLIGMPSTMSNGHRR